jgi:hypothetical protein
MTTSRDDMRERRRDAARREDQPATFAAAGLARVEPLVVIDVVPWPAAREPRQAPFDRRGPGSGQGHEPRLDRRFGARLGCLVRALRSWVGAVTAVVLMVVIIGWMLFTT